MPKITRRIRTLSFQDFCARPPGLSFQKDFVPWDQKPFEGFLPSVGVCACGAGVDACAFLTTIGSVAESPLEHC